LVKTMEQVERPGVALRLWRDSGALPVLIPALANLDDVALATLDELPRASAAGRILSHRTSNRLAALFLDISPTTVRRVLTDLRFSKHEANWATGLAERWRQPGEEIGRALVSRVPGDGELRRWVARLGRLQTGAFLRVALARWRAERAAGGVAPSDAAVRALYRRMRRILYRDPIELADLRVDGDDLRRAGIPAGPIYAKILHALLERVLDEPARNTPEALLSEVPRLVAALSGPTDGVANPSRPD
jgi:tRNA nucleotidyltransferase (CCA-adding enzyme)